MGEQSFTAMAGPKAEGAVPEIGVGMLGYAFMGKAHSNAYKKLPYMMYPPPAIPKLAAIDNSRIVVRDGAQLTLPVVSYSAENLPSWLSVNASTGRLTGPRHRRHRTARR